MISKRKGVTGPVPADPGRRSKAVALHERGLAFKQIADILDVTRQRAHQLVQSAEPSVRASRRAERNRRMLALWQRGTAVSTLAREFNMADSAVRYALRRAEEDAS
jgi:orotate phosphoribosyltransferase-like protein